MFIVNCCDFFGQSLLEYKDQTNCAAMTNDFQNPQVILQKLVNESLPWSSWNSATNIDEDKLKPFVYKNNSTK